MTTTVSQSWYFYDATGAAVGPVSIDDIRQLARQGTITPDTRLKSPTGQVGYAKQLKGLDFGKVTWTQSNVNSTADDLRKEKREKENPTPTSFPEFEMPVQSFEVPPVLICKIRENWSNLIGVGILCTVCYLFLMYINSTDGEGAFHLQFMRWVMAIAFPVMIFGLLRDYTKYGMYRMGWKHHVAPLPQETIPTISRNFWTPIAKLMAGTCAVGTPLLLLSLIAAFSITGGAEAMFMAGLTVVVGSVVALVATLCSFDWLHRIRCPRCGMFGAGGWRNAFNQDSSCECKCCGFKWIMHWTNTPVVASPEDTATIRNTICITSVLCILLIIGVVVVTAVLLSGTGEETEQPKQIVEPPPVAAVAPKENEAERQMRMIFASVNADWERREKEKELLKTIRVQGFTKEELEARIRSRRDELSKPGGLRQARLLDLYNQEDRALIREIDKQVRDAL